VIYLIPGGGRRRKGSNRGYNRTMPSHFRTSRRREKHESIKTQKERERENVRKE